MVLRAPPIGLKTFGAPFTSNWHQRLGAPQLVNSSKECTTEKHAQKRCFFFGRVATKWVETISMQWSKWESSEGKGASSDAVLLTTCSVWSCEAGLERIYKPLSSLPSFSPSLSLFLSSQTGAVVLSLRTYSTWPASLGVHRHSAD